MNCAVTPVLKELYWVVEIWEKRPQLGIPWLLGEARVVVVVVVVVDHTLEFWGFVFSPSFDLGLCVCVGEFPVVGWGSEFISLFLSLPFSFSEKWVNALWVFLEERVGGGEGEGEMCSCSLPYLLNVLPSTIFSPYSILVRVRDLSGQFFIHHSLKGHLPSCNTNVYLYFHEKSVRISRNWRRTSEKTYGYLFFYHHLALTKCCLIGGFLGFEITCPLDFLYSPSFSIIFHDYPIYKWHTLDAVGCRLFPVSRLLFGRS